MIHLEIHLTGPSSLSQAVHAALANVIQDPLIAATGDASMASGDTSTNSSARCENCSKLRQQLTLLIYEVLNLENTMESKICEYVQRRLSEIAVTEQVNHSNGLLKSTSENSRSSETIAEEINDSTMAENNNNHHHLLENSNSNSFKYRAERTLTFENVLIGDSTLKYLDPARFDVERKTYIKTMVSFRRNSSSFHESLIFFSLSVSEANALLKR